MEKRKILLHDALCTLLLLGGAVAVCSVLSRVHDDNNPFAVLIFVLAVAIAALVTTGYVWGVVASVVGVFCVNYMFAYPFWSFDMSISGYPLTFMVMLVVSVVISTLTTRLKQTERLRYEVESEKLRADLLRALSHDLRTPLASIEGAGSLLLDSRRAEACSANFEKVRRYVKRLCTRLLPRTEEMGSEELRLLSAITPKGEVFYQGTVQTLADKCILFRDDYGAVSRLLLELIRAEALARGYHIITCPCAMHPEDKIDHILIPSLRLAFLTDNRWHPVRLSAAQTVRCSRFVDRENLSACRARLRFNERAAAELLEQACALMAQAKSCHDELETYYRTAVDFAQVDAAAAQCMELFGVG